MTLPLFPTSVVGSMPRPQYVKDLIADDADVSADDYRRLMESAVRSVVGMQEMAGLDVVTDGEWWRKSYIGVIAELSHGFELSTNPSDGRPWTIVVDKLIRRRAQAAHNVRGGVLRAGSIRIALPCTLDRPTMGCRQLVGEPRRADDNMRGIKLFYRSVNHEHTNFHRYDCRRRARLLERRSVAGR